MNLKAILEQLQSSGGIDELANRLGIDPQITKQLTSMLAPAIGSATKKRAESGDLSQVLEMMRGESRADLVRRPAAAAEPDALQGGMDFLEKILGSREATHSLARETAKRSNADVTQIESLLPALAAMLQGGMQKQVPDESIDVIQREAKPSNPLGDLIGGLLGGGRDQSGPLGDIGRMLDDGSGSELDDFLDQLMKR